MTKFMEVESKIRKEFVFKQILGFGLGIILIPLCFYKSYYDGAFDFDNPLFSVGCIISVLFLIAIATLFFPKRLIKQIKVLDKGIEVQYYNSKKIQIIQ